MPKLTLELASVQMDSFSTPEPSSLFKHWKLNIFQEEATQVGSLEALFKEASQDKPGISTPISGLFAER